MDPVSMVHRYQRAEDAGDGEAPPAQHLPMVGALGTGAPGDQPWPAEGAQAAGGGFDLLVETSSLADPNTRGCELQDAWLDLRVPLERDAVGNYCFAEGNWRVSVSGR